MDKINLGTIGSGVIVHAFLDNVKITEGISLAAVYSRSRKTGQPLADQYGAGEAYTDLDAFLMRVLYSGVTYKSLPSSGISASSIACITSSM